MIPTHRPPTHPGEFVTEFRESLKLPQNTAAEKMAISVNRLSEIERGRRGVTADTALRLAKLFKNTPEFWMNAQMAWDLYHAKLAMKKTA